MSDVVGLTIQQRTLRAVETRVGRGGRCKVLRTGEVPLDPGVFDGGHLVDAEAFASCLKQLWSESNFKSKRVRVVIDGRLAVVRRTELPSLPPAKLRKAAALDIAELLNFPIEEAVFDVDEISQFERNETTWAQALVVAVEASVLTDIRRACRDAGLRVSSMELAAEALALGTAVTVEGDGPVAIIDCEDARTNIVVRDPSGVLFARTLSVGVGESTISVADELESALAQLSGADSDNSAAGGAGVSAVVESIRRTISYYSSELDPRPVDHVVVAGPQGNATGLLAALEQALDVPAISALAAAEWPNDINIPGFETEIGASIGSARSSIRHLQLTSDTERAARTRRRTRAALLATGLPAIAFFVMASAGLWNDVTAARESADQAEQTAGLLATRVSTLDTVDGQLLDWQEAVSDIAELEAQQLRFALVVQELAESMPADTQLLRIELGRGTTGQVVPGFTGTDIAGQISITGFADDIDGVSRWLTSADSSSVLDGLWLEQTTVGAVAADGEARASFSASGVITSAARPTDSQLVGELADTSPTEDDS